MTLHCDRRQVLFSALLFGSAGLNAPISALAADATKETNDLSIAVTNVSGPQGNLLTSYLSDGSGTPVIFIHSDGGVKEHWRVQMESCRGERPCAAFDRRGHGGSESPRNGEFGYTAESADVISVADALGFSRFILVGHSGGGGVAYVCAALNPGRIAGLLLVDPVPDPAAIPKAQHDAIAESLQKNYKAAITEYYRKIAAPIPSVVERVLKDALATPKATIIGLTEAQAKFKPAQFADKFTGPQLSILQSQFDTPAALHRIGQGFESTSLRPTSFKSFLTSSSQKQMWVNKREQFIHACV
jgi:pimeloyl-ACP methyl ester carboxylesterase